MSLLYFHKIVAKFVSDYAGPERSNSRGNQNCTVKLKQIALVDVLISSSKCILFYKK